MNKTQWAVILTAAALFTALYFGCDTKPDKHKIIEKQRTLAAVSTDIGSLLMEAKPGLSPQDGATILALETALNSAEDETGKANAFKELSSTWYKFEKPAIAGYYAEQVAEIDATEEAWSIAGTTFSICVQREKEKKVKDYCTGHAIKALENATSLNPSNLQHKMNLAIVHTENPPAGNPMKGILMLVDLNKQNPDYVPVLNQLGRLGIQTGQFEKAIKRLGKAVSLEPENPTSNCLLGEAYQQIGDQANAAKYLDKCKKLTID
ncbi:MAG TPA: tetratricopeptide repeat protein [Bacteroidetes bacterium]|nr:tetratricopeptide repeat protein [Bacteroidota bacterium]